MGYELDFIGVGKESKSGDAIALRFGDLYGHRREQTVVVIDGGFKDSGQDLVDHIKTHYGTTHVDLVISTHPDQDHINGLEVVFEQLTVGELWVHQPWAHSQSLSDAFVDGRVTDHSIGERLKSNLEAAYNLVKTANRKGIPVLEPFTGMSFGNHIRVMGPTRSYYESLIPEFDGMPATQSAQAVPQPGLLGRMFEEVRQFFATWGVDDIDDKDGTSAKNNSSVVTQIVVDDDRLICTGDAGVTALDYVADELDACPMSAELKFIQIPHHGSRRNVGPLVLDRIIGPVVPNGTSRNITAIASSSAKGEPKHPRKAVMNAFTHRGVTVIATRGRSKNIYRDAPPRMGWGPAPVEPYHSSYTE